MKKNSLLWIIKNTAGTLFPLFLLTLVSAAIAWIGVSFSLVSEKIINIATGEATGSFISAVGILAVMIVSQLILQALGSRLNVVSSGKFEIRLKSVLFKKLLYKKTDAVHKYHSGELLNRLTSDVSVVVSGFVTIAPLVISFGVRIVYALVILFRIDKAFACFYLVAGPLFVLLSRLYSKKMKSLHKEVQQTDGITRSYMTEAFQNLLAVKAFRREKSFSLEADKLQKENYKVKIRRNSISILANVLVYLAFTVGYYLALSWGAYRISTGVMTFGALTAMLQLVNQIQTPVKGVAELLPTYYSMIASAERLMELEQVEDEITGKKLDIKAYEKIEKIVFSDVCFSYEHGNPVLENFSYEIKKGEFVAIHGLSGIGKSTLLKLLLGVITPESGEIYFEYSGGRRVEITASARQLFAYVPQGNMVLSGTIRDNIAFYSDADDEEILKAASDAQMNGYLSELPEGINTVIGEKGEGLSEGQIQRIAIARALCDGAPILLLDEATSALDEKTEADFLSAVKNMKTKTCITVSHKQAAFDICDKIIEM